MIDTHCHLGDPAFADDLDVVVTRAAEAGVTAGLCVLSLGDEAEAERLSGLPTLWPSVRFAVGLHPHEAHRFTGRLEQLLPALESAWAGIPGVCAIGEIGLDYHYDLSPRSLQREVFAAQVARARALGRPVIIHTREADADTLDIVRTEGQGDVRGVFHCFSGTQTLASAALDLGFHLSFSGIVSFPKAESLRAVVATVPHDRLLLETDCPYLAPVPNRGRRNEPAFVRHTAAVVAQVIGLNVEDLDRVTTANAARLFGFEAS